MSTKVIASFVSILAVVLPFIGVNVGTDALTTTIQTIIVVISGVWVWFRTIKKEGRNILGVKK